MSNPLNGAGKFKTSFDAAVQSKKNILTDITEQEFGELKKLYSDAKGRFAITDGQSEALEHVRGKDPALAATLAAGDGYWDYMQRIYDRQSKGQRLPTAWRTDKPVEASNSSKYDGLPDSVKQQVLSFRETFDLNMEGTLYNKPGMLKGLKATEEWKTLETALAPYKLTVIDALRASRIQPE